MTSADAPDLRADRPDGGRGHHKELEFRRRWYDAHCARFAADADAAARALDYAHRYATSAPAALAILDTLVQNGDVEAFRAAMQDWAVEPGTLAFNGTSGQMMLNQLVKRSDDHERLVRVLVETLPAPRDDADAAHKTQVMLDEVERIRVGGHPAPGRINALLSYFWGLADHDRWPVLWRNAGEFLEYSTGQRLPTNPPDRYLRYLELVRELDDDHDRFEHLASWWAREKPVFLDPVLVDRCRFGLDHELPEEVLAANAAVLVSVAHHIGTTLADDLSRAMDRPLTPKKPPKTWMVDRPRSDLWVDWRIPEDHQCGLRLWVNHEGASIGIRPGQFGANWYDEAAPLLERFGLPGFRLLAGRGSRFGDDVGHVGGNKGEFTYARWFTPDQFEELDLPREVSEVAVLAQPVLDELVRVATGTSKPEKDDPLAHSVATFRARGYPSPADQAHVADRDRWAKVLAPDAIGLADVAELRRIWNTSRYGGPGPQSLLNTSLRDASEAEHDRIVGALRELCWGDGDDAERIDRVLEDPDHNVRGLGESVAMKLLAICHPDRYLPVFPYSGPKGKRRMLQLLELDEPEHDSRGQLQVEANDRLRARLEGFFPDDPWGMARFLYWHAEQQEVPEGTDEVDPLDEVAEELLVDRAFLDDLVALLADKGQVILYGPPGTGKTYLARRLAEALVPDSTRRRLVQFHPSTSYEDFFEGYRPETNLDGEMTYRLVPGPLRLLAERAAEAPGKRHVMIIDEINRANLPRVLGELLFLFEYRDEQISTLYRPDDAFELPRDLWFIGTMNTADRSIALVDAALRRRFHFVPFFPDHGPMEGLLDRWLAANGEPAWVGDLVAMVNAELSDALGGPHLQLGPSHFMRRDLDVDGLRRIWTYNIEPFIEDQFFGDQDLIASFRFDAVHARFRAEVGSTALVHQDPSDDPGDEPAGSTDDDGGP